MSSNKRPAQVPGSLRGVYVQIRAQVRKDNPMSSKSEIDKETDRRYNIIKNEHIPVYTETVKQKFIDAEKLKTSGIHERYSKLIESEKNKPEYKESKKIKTHPYQPMPNEGLIDTTIMKKPRQNEHKVKRGDKAKKENIYIDVDELAREQLTKTKHRYPMDYGEIERKINKIEKRTYPEDYDIINIDNPADIPIHYSSKIPKNKFKTEIPSNFNIQELARNLKIPEENGGLSWKLHILAGIIAAYGLNKLYQWYSQVPEEEKDKAVEELIQYEYENNENINKDIIKGVNKDIIKGVNKETDVIQKLIKGDIDYKRALGRNYIDIEEVNERNKINKGKKKTKGLTRRQQTLLK